jgi:hypothetical protein
VLRGRVEEHADLDTRVGQVHIPVPGDGGCPRHTGHETDIVHRREGPIILGNSVDGDHGPNSWHEVVCSEKAIVVYLIRSLKIDE